MKPGRLLTCLAGIIGGFCVLILWTQLAKWNAIIEIQHDRQQRLQNELFDTSHRP